jgi:hypothetical protein
MEFGTHANFKSIDSHAHLDFEYRSFTALLEEKIARPGLIEQHMHLWAGERRHACPQKSPLVGLETCVSKGHRLTTPLEFGLSSGLRILPVVIA